MKRFMWISVMLVIIPLSLEAKRAEPVVAYYDLSREQAYRDWLARQPSLATLVEQAYRKFELGFDAIDHWQAKARRSALLPRLLAGYSADFDEKNALVVEDTVNVSGGDIVVGPEDTRSNYDLNHGQGVDVKMQWELSQLLYHRDQILFERERRAISKSRQDLAEKIAQFYLKRNEAALSEFMSASETDRAVCHTKRRDVDQILEALTGFKNKE